MTTVHRTAECSRIQQYCRQRYLVYRPLPMLCRAWWLWTVLERDLLHMLSVRENGGETGSTGCVPQLITRGEIRKMHGMQPGSGSDCLVAWCCPACGICQEAREVDIRAGAAASRGGSMYASHVPPQSQAVTRNN